jgi:uncharacterized LabA/DUF88 family protein
MTEKLRIKMALKKKKTIRIGVYYDGHYFYKASNYYKFDHPRQARISIQGLHNFIAKEVSQRLDADSSDCKVVEAHYFRGRSMKSGNEKAIVGERFFEDALTKEGVNLHYLPLIRGANNELKEKGIDVSLALDAYKKATVKTFDILALIAGDGDYLPLVRELQSMNAPINVMLLSWDFECANGDVTMTSQDLLEEVKYPIQMANVIDDRLNLKNPVITGLFEPRQIDFAGAQTGFQALNQTLNQAFAAEPAGQPSYPISAGVVQPLSPFPPQASPLQTTPVSSFSKRKALTEAEMAQERISTILSLNGTGGWIRDVEYNNFYFFYSDVVNKKPEELAAGMTLQFRLRFDRKKTEQKDNGEPSYRAIGPIYVVD